MVCRAGGAKHTVEEFEIPRSVRLLSAFEAEHNSFEDENNTFEDF